MSKPAKSRSTAAAPPDDHVDHLVAQWRRELPDLDTEPMTVLGRIYRLGHLVAGPITASFEALGLQRGEFDVLGSLLRSGAPYCLTPTELYRSLMISSGGLTDRLRRLQRARLITRDASPEDARSLRVRLTAAGKDLAEAAVRADMALEAQLVGELSRDERRALAGLLRKLTLVVERRLAV